MSDPVIRVENLGKHYRLRHQQSERHTALRDVIAHSAQSFAQRLNPLNVRKSQVVNQHEEEFWALKDVSFEVNAGDRIGIIGRNGAGKSTLLKILSRITEPSTGSIRIKGRVASLLEVGTGFHPELTGRENIFLNGAILGMGKTEIRRKFDEIVAFAEVEKFLDTPVKRYSSGMYVRLAFAVAAHLEPEILIIDEVLAVGDFQFQKKCLGKMEQVGQEGRTVIFVSHNMATVNALCQRAVWLVDGRVEANEDVGIVTRKYLLHEADSSGEIYFDEYSTNDRFKLSRLALLNARQEKTASFDIREKIILCLEYMALKDVDNLEITIRLQNASGVYIFSVNRSSSMPFGIQRGNYSAKLEIPENFLSPGSYSIDIGVHIPNSEVLLLYESAIYFEVEETGSRMSIYKGSSHGVVIVDFPWEELDLGQVDRTEYCA